MNKLIQDYEIAIKVLEAQNKHLESKIRQLEAQSGTDMNVPRWISVKEKLPDDGLDVIVYTDRCGGNIEYAYYRYGRDAWFKNCVLLCYNVTHWMPLPEAPKEHQ